MAADSRLAAICLEQNNKVPEQDVRSAIDRAWAQLKAENNRRPAAYSIRFAGKEEIGISAPDFLLGAFRNFIAAGPAKAPLQRDRLLFECLRDEIRLISNADTGDEFGRRNAIDVDDFRMA